MSTHVFSAEDNFDLTVFVGNLNSGVTTEILKKFFMDEGLLKTHDINRIGIIWRFMNASEELGVTFVELANNEAFQIALSLNARELSGKIVIIVPALCSHKGLLLLYAPISLSINESDVNIDEKKISNFVSDVGGTNDEKNDKVESSVMIGKENIEIHGDVSVDCDNNKQNVLCTSTLSASTSADENKEPEDPNLQSANENASQGNEFINCSTAISDEHNVSHLNEGNDKTSDGSPLSNSKHCKDNVEDDKGIIVIKDCTLINSAKEKNDVKDTSVDMKPEKHPNSSPDIVLLKEVNDQKKEQFKALAKNLPVDVKRDDLLKFFNLSKEKVEISFVKDSHSRRSERSLRATISCSNEESLNKCIAKTRSFLHNRKIFVERYDNASKTCPVEKKQDLENVSGPDSTLSSTKLESTTYAEVDSNNKMELDLFIKHIHRNVTDRQLIDLFSSAGAIIKYIYRFPDLNKGRGMAFAKMADAESVLNGLAMNGKVIYGIKIKVSIRNDRKNLMPPIKDENFPNFSTFISCLPVKESADTLRACLKNFLEMCGCAIKYINVPLAMNHSGNKGYAFVSFENEESLIKCQKFHRSEILLSNCKAVVDISKQWPEIKAEVSPTRDKNRDIVNTPGDDSSRRQNKRRRKGTTPPRTSWDFKNKDSNNEPSWPKQFKPTSCEKLSNLSESSPYITDYKKYNFSSVNDYLSSRKSYDNKSFLSYDDQGSTTRDNDYNSQQRGVRQSYSMMPHSSTQNDQFTFTLDSKVENEDFSLHRPRGYVDHVKYGDIESSCPPVSDYTWSGSTDYRMGSHRSDKDYGSSSSPLKLSSTSGFSRSSRQLFDSSSSIYDSRNRYYTDRDVTLSSFASQDTPLRNSWLGSVTTDYNHSTSKIDYNSGNTTTSNSSVRSMGPIYSCKGQTDDELFSRLDRRPNPISGSDHSLYSGSNDGLQKFSFSSSMPVSSLNRYSNEITHYGYHLLSSDEKQKQSIYDKSSSFVTKLASSGILSNAGYDSYPGVAGYRTN